MLAALGVYSSFLTKGFSCETMAFNNSDLETLNNFHFDHQHLCRMKALRISRQAVTSELLAAAEERGISVKFDMKFSHTVEDHKSGVSFQFAGTSVETATGHISADGIHSRVRKFVAADIKPIYSGQLAIMSSIEHSVMRFPSGIDYPLPAIIYAKRGAVLLILTGCRWRRNPRRNPNRVS
jgi:2-polyprenyl-6-methoxyphenol hydroxylase-like FAD-dependent oxidoreductase